MRSNDEPAQARHVAHFMTFHYVAKHRNVDVVVEQPHPGGDVEALYLGKAAGGEPVEKARSIRAVDPRATPQVSR